MTPSGVVSTGWPAVEGKCVELGLSFRWWQRPIGRLILAKRADGKYAATIGGTGLSIPRQVGKTFLVAAIVFALCLLRPGLTVIWTAHRLRTGEETFKKMQALTRRKKIAPHVLKVVLGSGEEEILFRNGSRVMFGARERGFGRGFDEVDVLIFDEAQILTENALDDMVPATNQSRQDTGALLLYLGTPPKPSDPGEVFRRMRTDALSGEDRDTGWVEFGADPDYVPTALPGDLSAADWAQIAKANPSFPDDTPRESILRMRKKLGEASFLREGLGIWDEFGAELVFPAWPGCADPGSAASRSAGPLGWAVEVAQDRSWSCVAVVGARADGLTHVQVVENHRGTDWVVGKLREHGVLEVALSPNSPAGSLIEDLDAAGIGVLKVPQGDYAAACGRFFDLVRDGQVRHLVQAELETAVRGAVKRTSGDAWVLDRKGEVDISPLAAVVLASWCLVVRGQVRAPAIW